MYIYMYIYIYVYMYIYIYIYVSATVPSARVGVFGLISLLLNTYPFSHTTAPRKST